MTVIGERTLRTDAEGKVRGEAVFGADYEEQSTVHARILRSPVPAGKITRLDMSAAAAMPGVLGIYSAEDAGGHKAGQVVRDQALLATDVVRYEGDAIAAVVAQTAREATLAMRAIELEIEEWDAVGDIESALAEGARLVHPDWQTYAPSGPEDHPRHDNVAGELISDPDPEAVAAAFEAAHLVVEDEYRAVRQYQAYMEPKNCLARFENGRYTIHTGSQYPFNVRDRVAQYLDVRPSQVRVVGLHIGGGFGAKLDAGPEPYAALLARLTRRPVKLVYDRVEDLLNCPSRGKRHRAHQDRPCRRRRGPRSRHRGPDGQRRLQRRDAMANGAADARVRPGLWVRGHQDGREACLYEYGPNGCVSGRGRDLPLLRP